jgi:hypothetical protein
VQVFVNGEGFTVGVQAKRGPRGGSGGGSGAPPPPPPDREDDDDFSGDGSTDNEWNKHGRRKKVDQPDAQEKGRAGTLDVKGGKTSGKQAAGLRRAPVAGWVWEGPNLPKTFDQYGSNLEMGSPRCS